MIKSKPSTYTFHATGLHCQSCVLLIESALSALPEVRRVQVSLGRETVAVTGDFGDKTAAHLAADFGAVLAPHGYGLSVSKTRHLSRWSEFRIALPAALAFITLFFLLQKLGLVNLVGGGEVTIVTAFVVGLIASVSTCLAVVGGLVLSLSANFAKGGERVRPQLLFHGGRLVAFFFLGGVIGALGSAFQLGATGLFVLSFLVALVLIILGLNLLDLWPRAKAWQFTLPGALGRGIRALPKLNHTLTPLLVGVATFFLPCGFTQSMQLYTLTTGNFWSGALTMFAFALGTLPVLALLSFGGWSLERGSRSGTFFKTAGLIVIFFGLFNLLNSLVGMGWLPPLFNF
jgi:sulfite exporter TauE/SafE/copper chaperone CopZ